MMIKPKSVLLGALMLLLVALFAALVACAPNTGSSAGPDAGSSADSSQNAPQVAYSADTDCTACHTPEAESYEQEALLVSRHSSSDCLSCHDDLATLSGVHDAVQAGDKTADRLIKTKVSNELCLSCHPADARITATAGLTVLTDKNGTVVNPHDLPANADHEGITCADCHKMHKDEPVAITAQKTCTGCHHQDVFECYTCHD